MQSNRDQCWCRSLFGEVSVNELMAKIHSPMPVILHEKDWKRWLNREVIERPPIDLLRPYESDGMEMQPCNPAVGNVRNNGPEMLECPVPEPGLPLNSA
jgi:putative SOS response-associated peptidase YedK